MTFDILIPIHNALEETKACIESIIANSDLPYKLILLNDGSDEDTTQYLLSLQNPAVEILTFAKQGYLKTINAGLLHSTAPYKICLNSDTLVPKGWLQKLLNCIESDPKIGLVSPLTNNGVALSISIPQGSNYYEVENFITQESKREYPDACTAMGFCLLIKQEVIDKIGVFDVAYDPGYYEECDYHYRAKHAGFRSVICDNLYIYHKGQASFKDKKVQILNKNRMIFHSRWDSIYQRDIKEYEKLDALGYLRSRWGKALMKRLPLNNFEVIIAIPKIYDSRDITLSFLMAINLVSNGHKAGLISFSLPKATYSSIITPMVFTSTAEFVRSPLKAKFWVVMDGCPMDAITKKVEACDAFGIRFEDAKEEYYRQDKLRILDFYTYFESLEKVFNI